MVAPQKKKNACKNEQLSRVQLVYHVFETSQEKADQFYKELKS